ncbi:MAG: molecular chaperone Tir, partial [Alphaproteobacteria bacterium]|nr:molecular chaperone Tir [Alphaproteobacteria bacterium]
MTGKQHTVTIIYNDGKKYVGGWKGDRNLWSGPGTTPPGKPHGQGTATYPDGSTYVGEWKDGKKHGYGVYTKADGRVKKGTWVYDE